MKEPTQPKAPKRAVMALGASSHSKSRAHTLLKNGYSNTELSPWPEISILNHQSAARVSKMTPLGI
jgi:hypothetical protein